MKYIITGSLGNISKPLTQQLVAAGHEVTVISNSTERKSEIEQLGAQAAIGSVLDVPFLTATFKTADVIYLMIPPTWVATDWPTHLKQVADNYIQALSESEVKKVVQLSSIGAHLGNGAGPIDGLAYLEQRLKALEIDVLYLRPSYFYTNLYAMSDLIKQAGIMGSNFGAADEKFVLTHPKDIADAAFKYLSTLDFKGHTHQYVSSDVRTFSEIAQAIGNAINKPDLPWVTFTDEQAFEGMTQAGLAETIAQGYLQMGIGIREGKVQEDYFKSQNQPQGKVKLEDFAKEFAAAF